MPPESKAKILQRNEKVTKFGWLCDRNSTIKAFGAICARLLLSFFSVREFYRTFRALANPAFVLGSRRVPCAVCGVLSALTWAVRCCVVWLLWSRHDGTRLSDTNKKSVTLVTDFAKLDSSSRWMAVLVRGTPNRNQTPPGQTCSSLCPGARFPPRIHTKPIWPRNPSRDKLLGEPPVRPRSSVD